MQGHICPSGNEEQGLEINLSLWALKGKWKLALEIILALCILQHGLSLVVMFTSGLGRGRTGLPPPGVLNIEPPAAHALQMDIKIKYEALRKVQRSLI